MLAYSQKVPNAGPTDYKYQRVYPESTAQLFSDIVGYDSSLYGTWGAEYEYNDQLVSHQQPPHSLGEFINPTTSTDDVYLTVQPKLQALAQQELAGRDGAVVVLNPTTGAVLAMYGNPTYDPNLLASSTPAVQTKGRFLMLAQNEHGYTAFDSLPYAERWAPGSTFKVITTAAAYDYAPLLVNKSYPVQASTKLPQSNLLLAQRRRGGVRGHDRRDAASVVRPGLRPLGPRHRGGQHVQAGRQSSVTTRSPRSTSPG